MRVAGFDDRVQRLHAVDVAGRAARRIRVSDQWLQDMFRRRISILAHCDDVEGLQFTQGFAHGGVRGRRTVLTR